MSAIRPTQQECNFWQVLNLDALPKVELMEDLQETPQETAVQAPSDTDTDPKVELMEDLQETPQETAVQAPSDTDTDPKVELMEDLQETVADQGIALNAEKNLFIAEMDLTGIENTLEHLLSTNTFNGDAGTTLLAELEERYRNANQVFDSEASNKIKLLIDKVKPLIVELQCASKTVTSQDLRTFQSFFERSLETIYTDSRGRQYTIADDSQLFSSALGCWAKNPYYKGVEVCKRFEVKDPDQIKTGLCQGNFTSVCDLVFFQKTSGQVSQEFPSSSPFSFFLKLVLPSNQENSLKGTQEKQRNMFTNIFVALRHLTKNWGYIGYAIFMKQDELLSLGLSPNSAQEHHAIALFLTPHQSKDSI